MSGQKKLILLAPDETEDERLQCVHLNFRGKLVTVQISHDGFNLLFQEKTDVGKIMRGLGLGFDQELSEDQKFDLLMALIEPYIEGPCTS